jgi:hypothetical protein
MIWWSLGMFWAGVVFGVVMMSVIVSGQRGRIPPTIL